MNCRHTDTHFPLGTLGPGWCSRFDFKTAEPFGAEPHCTALSLLYIFPLAALEGFFHIFSTAMHSLFFSIKTKPCHKQDCWQCPQTPDSWRPMLRLVSATGDLASHPYRFEITSLQPLSCLVANVQEPERTRMCFKAAKIIILQDQESFLQTRSVGLGAICLLHLGLLSPLSKPHAAAHSCHGEGSTGGILFSRCSLISKFLLITLSEELHYYNHVILNTDPIAWVVLWISLNSLRDSVWMTWCFPMEFWKLWILVKPT